MFESCNVLKILNIGGVWVVCSELALCHRGAYNRSAYM